MSAKRPESSALRIIFAVLTIITLANSISQARLDNSVRPTHQSIELKVNGDTTHYSGSVVIDINIPQTIPSFQLHAEEMELLSVSFANESGEVEVSWESGKHGLLTITGNDQFAAGDYKLSIDFINDFNTNAVGLYRAVENENGYLFTQFEEDDAREAFPCFDEPEFKIPFSMTLIVPDIHLAVANTPIFEESSAEGWRKVVFAKTKPLPTYLLAMATGKLETVDIPGMSVPTRVITVAGKTDMTGMAVRMTPPILAALENYFGRPYPYAKLDLIGAPEFWAGAMENAGLITFRESALLTDDASASIHTRRRIASIIAHELAHMWFGDLVTMKWWDDLWLNESFASWMGDKVIHEVFPEFNVPISVVRSTQWVMGSDAQKSTSPIRQETTDEENLLANIGIIYTKGQAILEMFEEWVGEEAFQEGIRAYINKHEWGNAEADDLWQALTESTDRDMNAPLSTFILQPGVPLVTIEPADDGSVKITQTRFANFGTEFPDAPLWQIPITLKYSTNGKVERHSLLLTEASTTVRLRGETKPDWILPNADMAGYFRWTAPPTMLESLASNAAVSLTTAERVGLMSNMSGLLSAGLITGGDFLNVIGRFANDENPEVIRGVMGGIYRIYHVFENENNSQQFARYISETLKPSLDRVGLVAAKDEDESITSLRGGLVGMLADEGKDQEVLDFALSEASKYMEDPLSVDPSMAGSFVYFAAVDGDQALFDEYKRRFENATSPRDRSRFLSALGDFKDSALVEQALDYALNGDLRPQEISSIPGSVSNQSEAMHDYIIDWLMEHFEEIYERIPPPSRAYVAYYASGCSEARLKTVSDFLTQPERSIPGIETRLARVAEGVHDCVDLKAREEASVAQFLNSFAE